MREHHVNAERIAMKRLASLAALAVFAALPAAAQTAYPMVCRGGGAMMGSFTAAGGVSMNFLPGTAGAGAGAPAAGECRWLDRAFRAGEPGRMALAAGNPANALYLIGAALRAETFYVHVYNDGAGNMRVMRVGP